MNRTTLRGLVAAMVFAAGGPAFAGTAGGVYDMRAMLNERHPFAGGTAPAAAAATAPPPPVKSTVRDVAPPPPVMRFTPPPGPAPDEEQAESGGSTGVRVADRAPPPDDVRRPPRRGFYFSYGAGLDSPEDLVGHTVGNQSFETELNDGVLINGAVGRYFTRELRAEVEIAYRNADYDRTVVSGNQAAGGDFTVTTVMLNAFYDIDVNWRFVPYFGGGIGVARLDGDDVFVGSDRVPGRDDTEFAFQGMIGLTYLVSPHVGLGFDARYMGTTDDDASAISVGVSARFDL